MPNEILATCRLQLEPGSRAHRAVGFLRGEAVAVVAPRLVTGLGGNWSETTVALPECRWRNDLTGERFNGGLALVSELVDPFPVALLSREGTEP